jgi:hypothetical protein
MERLTPEAWAALRAEGEPAMQASAPAAAATARERLLAHYRHALLEHARLDPTAAGEAADTPWSDAEVAAWNWIDSLANAGHAGAGNLRLRIMDCAGALDVLARRDPGRLEQLARVSVPAALARARLACEGDKPDIDEVLHWLSAAKAYDPSRNNFEKVIAALRHAGGPRRVDFAALRKLLQPAGYSELKYSMRDSAAVMALVGARRASADAKDREAAAPLLVMAAWLGSNAARDELIAAGDPAVVLHWLDDQRRPAVADAIKLLRALETRIGPDEMLVFRNACYLGLAGGPGAVPDHGNEPYAARLLYVLAHLKLRQSDAGERSAGEQLRAEAARRGSRRAQLERYRADGNLDQLLASVEAGNEAQLAAAIRELQAIAGAPSEADLAVLDASILKAYTTGMLVHAFAGPPMTGSEKPANACCGAPPSSAPWRPPSRLPMPSSPQRRTSARLSRTTSGACRRGTSSLRASACGLAPRSSAARPGAPRASGHRFPGMPARWDAKCRPRARPTPSSATPWRPRSTSAGACIASMSRHSPWTGTSAA